MMILTKNVTRDTSTPCPLKHHACTSSFKSRLRGLFMPISEISVDCDIFVTRVTNVTKAKNVTYCHLFITLVCFM